MESEGGRELMPEGFDFFRQMKFIKELTDTAESLRHIDISLRKETLRSTLQRIQNEYRDVYFPITRDYGPMPRVIRVCVDEGAVFRSKARVPVLICFEVLAPGQASGGKTLRRRRTSSVDYISEQEVEDLLDKGGFHQRMNSLGHDADAVGVAAKSPSPTAGKDDGTIVVDLTEDEEGGEQQQQPPARSGTPTSGGSARAGSMSASLSSGSLKEMGARRGPLTPSMSSSEGSMEAGSGGGKGYASKDEVLKFVLHRRKKVRRPRAPRKEGLDA